MMRICSCFSLLVVAAAAAAAVSSSSCFALAQSYYWGQAAYGKPSVVGDADRFGWSVSLDADRNRVAVGAPFEDSCSASFPGDNECPDSGAVYLFERVGSQAGNWSQVAFLKAQNAGNSDSFGHSVSLRRDRLAVGAPHEQSCSTLIDQGTTNDACDEAGAAYVFRRDPNGVWSQEVYLKAPNANASHAFGWSVSLAGDGAHLAVGAPDENSCSLSNPYGGGCPESGAVYFFQAPAWATPHMFKASDAQAGDAFGYSVSLDADPRNLAVGAPGEDACFKNGGACPDAGAVYIFREDVVWTEQAILKASNAGSQDRFGSSVSLDASRLAVGAPEEDECADSGLTKNGTVDNNLCSAAGAVYIYRFESVAGWTFAAYIKATNADPNDHFGHHVALDGSRLAVSARAEASCITGDESDGACHGAGAAYVYGFRSADSTWVSTSYVKAAAPDGEDSFGASLALDGDFLVVGASREDGCEEGINGTQTSDACDNSGAFYVFTRVAGTGPPPPPSSSTTAAAVASTGVAIVVPTSSSSPTGSSSPFPPPPPPTGSTAGGGGSGSTTTPTPREGGTDDEVTASGEGPNGWMVPVVAVVAILLCLCLVGGMAFLAFRKRTGDDDESDASDDDAGGADASPSGTSTPIYNTTAGLRSSAEGTESPIYNSVGGFSSMTPGDDGDDPVYNTTEDIRTHAAESNYHSL